MEGNDILKETDIKNRTCYYFEDFDFDNTLIDEKSYKNILLYNISYIHLIAKHMRIRFYKIDGFIRVNDYLILVV